MSRTPAKFTQADLARAVRAAKAEGMMVRVLPDGTMEFCEKPARIETQRYSLRNSGRFGESSLFEFKRELSAIPKPLSRDGRLTVGQTTGPQAPDFTQAAVQCSAGFSRLATAVCNAVHP